MAAQSGESRQRRRQRVQTAMNVVLALTGAAAIAVLVLEYGGFERLQERFGHVLHVTQSVIVAVLVLDRFLRVVLAERRWAYVRANWIDFALIAVLLAVMLIVVQLRGKLLSAGALYVAISQGYILIALLVRGLNVNLHVAGSGVHPTRLLIGSFAILSLVGSALLMLPVSRTPDSGVLYYEDALFTAVSATCVTGLVVRDTGADYSHFGQAVILVMIQLGGLGIMMFGTVAAMLIGKGLTMRGSSAIGQMLGSNGIGQLARTMKFVVLVTLAAELIGAAMLLPMFTGAVDTNGQALSTAGALWHSVFHSISSFCNAGFALYGHNMMQGVQEGWDTAVRDRWQIFGVIAPLIILGGLGFPVLQDVASCGRAALSKLRRRRPSHGPSPRVKLTLHSKLVLASSALLIVMGAAVLMAIEPPGGAERVRAIGRHEHFTTEGKTAGDWAGMTHLRRCREALFQSISARTAGFNTINVDELSDAGKLWMCGLMTIGGSPASTAGGMKTTTVVLLVLAVYCSLRRRNELEIFRRSIHAVVLRRVVTLAVLYLFLLGGVTLLLCVAMRGHNFIDLLFEACSACGTVGLSTGVTGDLTVAGKCIIVGGMFIGRLGPLTLLLALTSKIRRVEYSYPAEHVMIG